MKKIIISFLVLLCLLTGWPLPVQEAHAAISFVGSAEDSSSPNQDTTVDLSGLGLQQDDLVIVAAGLGDDDSTDYDLVNNTAGYNEVADLFANDTDDTHLAVWWKIMGASPDTSVTIEGSGTAGTDGAQAVVVMAFRGVDTSSPMDVTPTTTTGISSFNPNPPSIDHNNPSGVWTVIAGASAHVNGGTGTYTFPSGYTTNAIDRGHDDTNDITVGMGYRISPADPENPDVMTHSGLTSGTNSWAAATLALRPASAAASTYTQNDFEWYLDEGSVTLSEPWPSGSLNLAENTILSQIPATNKPLVTGDKIRVQINVSVGTANLSSGGEDFQLEYTAGEDCTTASSWADVGAIGSGSIWRFFDNTSLTDGTTEANQISTSDVAGDYVESNPTQTNPNAVNSGQDMEWDFALENNGAAENTTYCFRMVVNDGSSGTVFAAYNSDGYPKLTTAPGTGNLMRHGNFFQNETEKGFFWAN